MSADIGCARASGGDASAAAYARGLLQACGANDLAAAIGGGSLHADLEWARSGAMALTGRADGPPRLAPAPLALCARGAGLALARLAPSDEIGALDAPALLGERAAIAGLGRQGRVSPGGSARLLRCADGWLVLNLAREDDVALLPAWLECELTGGGDPPWSALASLLATRSAEVLVERARMMGMPAAPVSPAAHETVPWLRVERAGVPRPGPASGRMLVLDLSSLWAGPLCGALLAAAGARVIKLESERRPDGARGGPAAFYDLMNGGKPSVSLALDEPRGVSLLRELIARADVVVESARPRALRQLGIDARRALAERPGLSWISITGYGRREPGADWVAFGDDAAVAAGLASGTGAPDERPLFCGDAVADPLTGLHAAVAGLAAHRAGGGVLLDVALCGVVRHACAWPGADAPETRVEPASGGARTTSAAAGARWQVRVGGAEEPVAAPRARSPRQAAAPLGADTRAVLAELGVRS